MSKISFVKTEDNQTASVEVLPAVTALVPATASLPVQAETPPAFNDENIGFEDIRLPRINIVQKVGDLSNIFTPGEIVLNQQLVIHTPATKQAAGEPPLIFTVIGFRKKQYVEKTIGGALGRMFDNEADVVRASGTLDWKEFKASEGSANPKTLFQRLATALILIEKPAALEDADNINFPYDCDGKFYALALWSMKGTAYTHAAKHIFTARKIGHLRSGYPTQAWSLTTKLEGFGGNFAHVPVIKPASKNSDAFKTFVGTILGAND